MLLCLTFNQPHTHLTYFIPNFIHYELTLHFRAPRRIVLMLVIILLTELTGDLFGLVKINILIGVRYCRCFEYAEVVNDSDAAITDKAEIVQVCFDATGKPIKAARSYQDNDTPIS